MKFRKYFKYTIFIVVFVASCSNKNKTVQNIIDADTLIEQASADNDNDVKVTHVFQAIEKYIDGKLLNKAGKLLAAVDTSKFNSNQLNTYNFLQAKYNYEILKPFKALTYLSKIKNNNYNNSDYYKLKYQVNYALNRNDEAVASQIQYNKYLEENSIGKYKENNKEIWENLVKLSKSQVLNLKQEYSNDTHIQGWLDLALVFNTGNHDADESNQDIDFTKEKLNDWYFTNNDHDAVKLFNSNEENAFNKINDYKSKEINKLALLLPMSGKYKNIAEPIKLGFLSAYFNNKNRKNLSVIFIDSAKEYDINEIDADVIVGPLIKSEVKNVVKHKRNDNTKVLALNYTKTAKNNNVYQFGISAEDEAEQAALRVNNLGFQNTLVIAENSSWGNRVSKAFNTKFEELNNTVVEKALLNKNIDYQSKISKLLGIDDSNYRKYLLSKTLGAKLSHIPQRRKDIDSIFIALPSSQAKQVVPLLKYFYAEDLPVFSTSSIFNEKALDNNNNDLNNVQFCDIPGNLPENKNNHEFDYRSFLTAKMPKSIGKNRRIFALGIDAFNLALKLNDLEQMPFLVINGVTGKLNLSDENKIKRNLSWAKISKNKVKSLG